jgi:putative methyltransferase (TIGR04325 family)
VRSKPLSVRRIVDSLRQRYYARAYRRDSFRGIYETFAHAQRAAPRFQPFGYDDANAANWYRHKLERIALDDYPVVYWLRDALQTGRSIFELGGHVGVAYYGYQSILEYPAGLQWTICDVPSVIAAGEALASERGRTNLRFVTSPTQSEGADIVLAAGSLQYIDAPSLAETLAGFRLRPRHILINNLPVCEHPGFVTLQYIGTAFCAYRIFNRREFVGELEGAGYRLVDSWQKPRATRITGHPEKSFDHYTGFYFQAAQ